MGCGSLKSVLIPSSVKTVENHAFVSCDKLLSVEVESKISGVL